MRDIATIDMTTTDQDLSAREEPDLSAKNMGADRLGAKVPNEVPN